MADGLTFTVNTRRFEQALQRYGQAQPSRAAGALYREGERIMTEAKRRTPVDTGALRASGFVHPPVVTGQRITLLLGFGGAAAPYALIVHEDLQARHTVGQAKYLESVLHEALPGMDDRLAADLER
jgi:hypothetical protein